MKACYSANKNIFFVAMLLIAASICAAVVVASATGSHVSKNKCRDSVNEWGLAHPKAKNPDALPGLCETSVDLELLRRAKSLNEIYKLAEKMDVNSVSDNRVISKAATEYMIKKCPTSECALKELKKVHFEEITDITETVQSNPELYNVGDITFDKVLFSEQRNAKINFFSYGRFESEYRILLYLNQNKIVKANAYIFYNHFF